MDIQRFYEYHGDLSGLEKIADITEIDHNWITFKTRAMGLYVQAKIFIDGSTYGINDGRVSKISIQGPGYEKGEPWFKHCILNYDRGWDIRPTDYKAQQALNQILEALGDDPVNKMDWYEWDTGEYKCSTTDFDEAADDCSFVPFGERDQIKVTFNTLRDGEVTTVDVTDNVLEKIKNVQRSVHGDDIYLDGTLD